MHLAGSLVAPGSEHEVARAYRLYRARNLVSGAAALIVFAAALFVLYGAVLPIIPDPEITAADALRMFGAFVGTAALLAIATWWILSTFTGRQWNRYASDRSLMRPTRAVVDAYGPLRTNLSDEDLWEALEEEERIRELRVAHSELLHGVPAGARSAAHSSALDVLETEIRAAEQEQRARVSAPTSPRR